MTTAIRCGFQQTVNLDPDVPTLLCVNASDEDVAAFPDAPVCDGVDCGHDCHSVI